MIEAVGFFVLGLLLLALGGDAVVKGASGLARRFGLSPFAAGFAMVAMATSLPELAVNARAVWIGDAPLALGNAVGSNIANFGLTLGAAALCAPLRVRWRVLSPLLLCLVAATLAVIALGLDGTLSRVDGGVLLAALVAVAAFALARGRRQQADIEGELVAFTSARRDLMVNLVRIAIAAVLLYFGAKWVVDNASIIGEALGMESLLAGLLVVAIGTALPETAAAIAAARRGQGDIVAGHVIGSSLLNLLAVVGGMALYHDIALPASFVRFELPAALVFAAMLVPMLRGDLRISRQEGAAMLFAFVAWIAFELLLIHG